MPVIPKPASTVVLIDEESRVYLTKRPETMRFLGGYYVFPGGAVEKEDEEAAQSLNSAIMNSESFPGAHYIAAIRELFEEVGIFLGGRESKPFYPFDEMQEMKYRKQLIKGELSLDDLLKKEELKLHIDSLQYFGHFITPKESPIRFDTRFFLAKLPEGQTPKPDENEIAEAFWITPEEALVLHEENKIQMVPPTIKSLQAIIDYKAGKPLRISAPHPFF